MTVGASKIVWVWRVGHYRLAEMQGSRTGVLLWLFYSASFAVGVGLQWRAGSLQGLRHGLAIGSCSPHHPVDPFVG